MTPQSANKTIVTLNPEPSLVHSITLAQNNLINQGHKDGYWWYTLEANDSINAEYIMLLKYLEIDDKQTEKAICRWILHNQNHDGSWSLYYGAPGDLSATVECYIALKMAGFDSNQPRMAQARKFIMQLGGVSKIRVFSRIHLALFGLVDWKICPTMPVALIQFPEWAPVNIYEFSSWARASIVPLLVIMDQKKTKKITGLSIDELYVDSQKKEKWIYPNDAGVLSIENLFIKIDKALHVADTLKFKPLRKQSLKKCEDFIRSHLGVTEDIYPAMFYGVLALNSLGYPMNDTNIEKALMGLKSFQVIMSHKELHAVPFQDSSTIDYNLFKKQADDAHRDYMVYQQCCISPVWDTAWAATTLLKSGFPADSPILLKTARWLISKQITDVVGDWGIKNPGSEPGGWSFEFINKYYPDVDDTIEVLTFLHDVGLPYHVLKRPIEKGVNWLLSMQCSNGGFAAFDKDNDLVLLNKIPFSDHGACLDPPTVDITGRMIEFLIKVLDFDGSHEAVLLAADFITERQEKDGSFWARWGVNYIYGTWCALEGLCCLSRKKDELIISRAVHWLKSIQNTDGGFCESSASYNLGRFLPLPESVPSQTAWALMGLVAAGQQFSPEARKAADFLISAQKEQGGWDEKYYTGTGFPGHFYIRYHGYRYYFPLLALSKYRDAIVKRIRK
ncbi:MAG: hypothetical protein ACD_62C00607G0008 [uncultured bacterium]|nr:MAG: hypothetical protein ACD_62C00607G0008 [uncultured bacterium]HLD44483.1 prenyltransferase/squalene oxidase repeat-containing protein [bacterium]